VLDHISKHLKVRQKYSKTCVEIYKYINIFFIMFDCRVYNAISSEPSFVLILLHVISIPLTGKETRQFCQWSRKGKVRNKNLNRICWYEDETRKKYESMAGFQLMFRTTIVQSIISFQSWFHLPLCYFYARFLYLGLLLFARKLTSMSYVGLINAIAFGINKETLSRLNWGDMKVRCKQIC